MSDEILKNPPLWEGNLMYREKVVFGGWGAKLNDFRVKNNLVTTPLRHA